MVSSASLNLWNSELLSLLLVFSQLSSVSKATTKCIMLDQCLLNSLSAFFFNSASSSDLALSAASSRATLSVRLVRSSSHFATVWSKFVSSSSVIRAIYILSLKKQFILSKEEGGEIHKTVSRSLIASYGRQASQAIVSPRASELASPANESSGRLPASAFCASRFQWRRLAFPSSCSSRWKRLLRARVCKLQVARLRLALSMIPTHPYPVRLV